MILYGAIFAICLGLGIGFHVQQWSSGETASMGMFLMFSALSGVGYGALWLFLKRWKKYADVSPVRKLWTLLVSGAILTTIAGITSRIGTISAPVLDLGPGFDFETGIALTLPTIVKMVVVSLTQAIFAFLILDQIRSFVLVKRSRSSERNWNLMIIMMVVTSVLTIMNGPGESQNDWQNVSMVIAAVFMMVNAFRLSWIVFLPFKEKLAALGFIPRASCHTRINSWNWLQWQ